MARQGTVREVLLSPSKMATWATCRRKYELQYIEGWLPITDPPALVLGQAIHAGIAARLTGQEPWEGAIETAIREATLADDSEIPEIRAKARALVSEFTNPGWTIVSVERSLKVRMPSVQKGFMTGVIDLEVTIPDASGMLQEPWIVDHKTSGRYQTPEYALLDWQLMAYYAMAQREGRTPRGAIWHSIVIPGTGMHQGETVDEYEARLHSLIRAAPAKYFQVYPLIYTIDQVIGFWSMARVIANEIRRGTIYRNPKACQYLGCSYRNICLNSQHAGMMGYRQKEVDDAIADNENGA